MHERNPCQWQAVEWQSTDCQSIGVGTAQLHAWSAVPLRVKKRGSHVCDNIPEAKGRYFARYLRHAAKQYQNQAGRQQRLQSSSLL
jgi:hypothetical protein